MNITVIFLLLAASTGREQLLVMDLQHSDLVAQEYSKLASSLLVTHLRSINEHKVISQGDLSAMLSLESQKQLLNCSIESCMAEIGGALGARWLVAGSIDVLGEQRLLTLKLLDTQQASLENQISETLPEEDDSLIRAMEVASHHLLRKEAPTYSKPWYARTWVWVVVGVAAAGTTTAILLNGGDEAPTSNLGQVRF